MVVTREEFAQQLASDGFAILPHVIHAELLQPLKRDLEGAIAKESQYQQRTSAQIDSGMVLLCSLYPGELIRILELGSLIEPFEWILGEGCIIYAYTSSSMPPHGTNYSGRIHVDCPRLIPGYVTNLGATILLDDFTEKNGATWYLPKSHLTWREPAEKEFFSQAKRLVAKAGTVFFFNARLWHAGGQNDTDQWRHALTINMCRSFMKQRLDIPRSMRHMDLSGIPNKTLQKLGFFCQVPANYDEYYAPAHLRKYRQIAE
jgi:ectoine hydroxylase-related dioxygenase (phytanoyl-CoA dioxygenase family)